MLSQALCRHSAIAAFNAVDPTTMYGILRSVELHRAPVIVQLSERTVRVWGAAPIARVFVEFRERWNADSVLHLDHCRSPELALECLRGGWDSVLMDVSSMDRDKGVACTRRLVAAGRVVGADIEGEFDAIAGPGRATRTLSDPQRCREFVAATGVACLAPALGSVHGRTTVPPTVDHQRARAIADAVGVPLVLHGGTGLTLADIRPAVGCGVAKVNVSTALKETYLRSCRLHAGNHAEPLEFLDAVSRDVATLVAGWTAGLG